MDKDTGFKDNAGKSDAPKKVTIRDVAKVAGFSIATVSYVLNGRKDQTIPEETKKKVFQVANLLGYTPNYFVKKLASDGSSTIVIKCADYTGAPLKQAEFFYVLDRFARYLKSCGYNLAYLPDVSEITFSHVDAVLCFDMTEEQFHAISENNYIPVLAVNCLVGQQWLFYQIVMDYEKLKSTAAQRFQAPFTYVSIRPENPEIRQSILASFPDVVFVSDASDFIDAVRDDGRNILLTSRTLYDLLPPSRNQRNLFYCDSYLDAMTAKTADCIRLAVTRAQDKEHIVRV